MVVSLGCGKEAWKRVLWLCWNNKGDRAPQQMCLLRLMGSGQSNVFSNTIVFYYQF